MTTSLLLPPAARAALCEQSSQNGTFIHGFTNAQGVICALAYVVVEQCDTAVYVRVELGGSCNSITLARRDDTAQRALAFVLDCANGVSPSQVPEVDEYLLVPDLELALRDVIRTGGTSYLPTDDAALDLAVVVEPARATPGRKVFVFELHGRPVTLPLLLPSDREQAYLLLRGAVRELQAGANEFAGWGHA